MNPADAAAVLGLVAIFWPLAVHLARPEAPALAYVRGGRGA